MSLSPHPSPRCHALVVAAGRGSRFGGERPKQYCALGGRAVLRRSVELFATHPLVDGVLVAIHPDDERLYCEALEAVDLPPPVVGGATRQQSVLNLLRALRAEPEDLVLIHDAARPLASPALVTRLVEALETARGAIAALPVTDTLKRGQGTRVAGTVDRSSLWRAQTPQAFRYGPLLAAHESAAGLDLTDDAAIFEHAGEAVELVMGEEDNFKITTAGDLARAERILAAALLEVRTGSGFDVHQLADGDGCWINGIKIPCGKMLVGHSDADVGLHALTDAILGAIGAGDIGQHFPPSDPRWRGAASDCFLRHAAGLVRERGGMVAHVDVTILCEYPKIGPHRAAMVRRIGEILEIAGDRVSVKATTTERLGFTGRGEGIAAQAVATVRLPWPG